MVLAGSAIRVPCCYWVAACLVNLKSNGEWENKWWGRSLSHPGHWRRQVRSYCRFVDMDCLAPGLRSDFLLKHAMEVLGSSFECRDIWGLPLDLCQGWSSGDRREYVTDCHSRCSSSTGLRR